MSTLHGNRESGSTHRVRLLMHLIGLPHRYVEVDLAAGEHRAPEFLKLNLFGQVPVLQDAGRVLRDSHAILVYLARVHAPAWLPTDPGIEAEIQAWLSFSAGEVQQSLGRLHLARRHGEALPDDAEGRALGALRLVDHHLGLQRGGFLVGDRPTLADVALFPYLGLDLVDREGHDLAHLDRWLQRLQAEHGFVPMGAAPADAA
ncbi:MAG TPA: glutathione S-transferase family protein [Pseudomonadales bacterium]|nr:glutathione S-transferase family protein [Pseudomonadales bacterium]